MGPDQTEPTLEPVVTALAVLGMADQSLLATFTGIPLPQATLAALEHHPAVTVDAGRFTLQPDTADLILQTLEQTDLLHFRRLHRQGLALLAQKLAAGDGAWEPAFMRAFRHLADHVRHQAPDELPHLVALAEPMSLTRAEHQHFRAFVTGLDHRFAERYDQAIALAHQLLSDPELDDDLRGRFYNLRATCYYFQGHFQRALDDYQASLTLLQATGNRLAAGIVLHNMGALAYDLQDYAVAEARLRQAADLFAAEGSLPWLAAVENELGLLYRDQGRWSAALAAFEAFVAHSTANQAQEDVAIGLLNMGEVLFFQGRFALAVEKFQASLAAMTTEAFRIDTLLNLGLIHQINADFRLAEYHFQHALALAQKLGRRFALANVHYRLAHLRQAQQDQHGALQHLQIGIQLIEETRTPLRDEALKISWLGRWQQLYEAAVLLLVEQGDFAQALTYVERARARAFLDLLATNDVTGQVTVEEPLTAAAIQANLPAQTALVEFFATGLPGASETLFANLPPEAAHLRQYLLPPEQLWALVVTRTTLTVVPLAIRISQIQAQHFQRSDGRLRGVTPLPGQPLHPLRRWHDLARILLLPLQPFLAGACHLYLVPYAALHYVPFHALMDIDQLTGVAHTTVSYAPSASILLKTQTAEERSSARRAVLTIGVDQGKLTHAEAEARWIAQALQGDTLLGAAATVARVCTALPAYNVLHFSCHGYFRRREPMESALHLADGELTAAELLRSCKLTADLVVLSACDTGLNLLHPGDEPLGLTRAFLGCGACSLIVTLWPVHEIPTQLLMEHFYAAWQQGMTKAAALANAQRYVATLTLPSLHDRLIELGLAAAVIEATLQQFQAMLPGDRPFQHPYYWGAFLLVGAPE